MSKKNLLNEGTIRRFMKLAGTDVLVSDFLAEENKGHGPGKEVKPGANVVPSSGQLKETEELEEGEEVVTEQEEELAAGPEELGAEEDLGLDLEVPEDEEAEPEEETSVEEFARDVLDAIKDVAGEHGVDMEVEEMPPEELDVGELEPEEEGEGLELGGEETGEIGGEEAPEELEELEEVNYIDDAALMQEVYNRVTKRILRKKKTDDMAATLAEKISQRLSKTKQ